MYRGVPKPFSTQSVVSSRIRSWNGRPRKSEASTGGGANARNPMCGVSRSPEHAARPVGRAGYGDAVTDPSRVRLWFRVVAFAEACSWLGLLVGMYIKYVPETTEAGVKIFGPIHGCVFLAFVVTSLLA